MNSNSTSLSRRDFLKVGSIGTAALVSTGCANQIQQAMPNVKRKPNVIFMLADDLGYGDMSCYGAPDVKTPNLDRIAREGIRFTDAYANGPLCSPTRVAFLTGRYQQRLGHSYEDYLWHGSPGIDPNKTPTIAVYLKDAGYKTACYGKWNAGHQQDTMPHKHGFEHWIGITENCNYFTHRGLNPKEKSWMGGTLFFENGKPYEREGYFTDIIGDIVTDYIDKSDNKPFFLYLPWQAPHGPLQGPDEYEDRNDLSKVGYKITPEDRPVNIKIIERLDYQVGRIMQALKHKGIDDNTLVIFTSDNGGHKAGRNLPLRGGKQDVYEGGLRVPMIARWPGTIPAGQTTNQMAITMDITATIMAVTGASPKEKFPLDGIDLMPFLTGQKKPDPNRTLYWRRRDFRFIKKKDVVRSVAIRKGNWKYLRHFPANIEALFNLRDDIGEKNNLIAKEPDIAAGLRKQLETWEQQVTPKGPGLLSKSRKCVTCGKIHW